MSFNFKIIYLKWYLYIIINYSLVKNNYLDTKIIIYDLYIFGFKNFEKKNQTQDSCCMYLHIIFSCWSLCLESNKYVYCIYIYDTMIHTCFIPLIMNKLFLFVFLHTERFLNY